MHILIIASNSFMDSILANNRWWKLKVTIRRNYSGAPAIDISDRVISSDITFDWEKRNGSASLSIDNYDYSFSPLNQNSTTNQIAGIYDPLFDSNHIIEIWEGLLTVNGYEYIKRFTGLLGDEIDADSYPGIIQITARDMSKRLQDTYIYMSKTYSPIAIPVLTLAELVMQDMIDQFIPNSGIIIQVDSPTLFNVGTPDSPYVAKDINLWDALQSLSDAFNFALMFDENGVLRLKEVIRNFSGITPVHNFLESELSKDTVSVSDSNVRNHIMLRVQGLDPIEVKNEDSITKYGRRYMEVTRSMAYIITTAEQGYKLVNNFLQDLAYVSPIDKAEMPLFPLLQAGDIVSISNPNTGTDGVSYKFRVSRVQDSFSKDKKRTNFDLHGYVVVNPLDSIAPKAPTGLGYGFINRAIQNYHSSGWSGSQKTIAYPMLTWNQVTQDISNNALLNNFGGYTIYRRGPADSVFHVIASIKSYIEPLNLIVNYFYDYTATAGSNQYKITATNKFGKVSAESEIITIDIPSVIII
jgi:hypothetical protein